MQHILVVGGNGFVGSAVCKAALARNLRVTSLSSSGRPFRTPKGHAPAWTERVEWLRGDVLSPTSAPGGAGSSAEALMRAVEGKCGVVSTLGVLFESSGSGEGGGYKEAVRRGDPLGVMKSIIGGIGLGGRNPLEKEGGGEYEKMNRDAALNVCSTFASSSSLSPSNPQARRRPFVFVSAEDIFRPFVPARYIETKREAERGVVEMLAGRDDMRAVFVRPSLIYHSHYRPLTTPIATLLDLSASLHRGLPSSIPTPAGLLRSFSSPPPSSSPGALAPSPLFSIANALTVPPIHVDHVAEAIVCALMDDTLEGVLDVRRMREVIGWVEKGSGATAAENQSAQRG